MVVGISASVNFFLYIITQHIVLPPPPKKKKISYKAYNRDANLWKLKSVIRMLKIRNFGQKSVISSMVHGMQRCVNFIFFISHFFFMFAHL